MPGKSTLWSGGFQERDRGRESAGCQSAGHVPHARLRGLVEAVTAAGRPGMRRERQNEGGKISERVDTQGPWERTQ